MTHEFYRIPTTSQTYADGSALAEVGGWHLVLAETDAEETEYGWSVALYDRQHALNVRTLHHREAEARRTYDNLLGNMGAALPCPICGDWGGCPCHDSEAEAVDARLIAFLRRWAWPVEEEVEAPF